MRKITLDLDTLQVASFDTGSALVQRGTVDAKENCPYTYCNCSAMCSYEFTMCPVAEV